MTLFQLAVAGHDGAKDIAERLNLTCEDTHDSKTVGAMGMVCLLIELLWM